MRIATGNDQLTGVCGAGVPAREQRAGRTCVFRFNLTGGFSFVTDVLK